MSCTALYCPAMVEFECSSSAVQQPGVNIAGRPRDRVSLGYNRSMVAIRGAIMRKKCILGFYFVQTGGGVAKWGTYSLSSYLSRLGCSLGELTPG